MLIRSTKSYYLNILNSRSEFDSASESGGSSETPFSARALSPDIDRADSEVSRQGSMSPVSIGSFHASSPVHEELLGNAI